MGYAQRLFIRIAMHIHSCVMILRVYPDLGLDKSRQQVTLQDSTMISGIIQLFVERRNRQYSIVGCEVLVEEVLSHPTNFGVVERLDKRAFPDAYGGICSAMSDRS